MVVGYNKQMNEVIDIAIIGAGASGLMLASLLERENVVLFEGNSKAGAKIAISGGGRCNISNEWVESLHYLGNPYFVDEVLRRFDQDDLLAWLKIRGLKPVLHKNRQYFCPKSANQLLDIFKKEIQKHTLLRGRKIERVSQRDGYFLLESEARSYRARRLVIASGGLSFPQLGASDIGYRVAEIFGHTIVNTAPALVGFTLQREQFFFKELSGISAQVEIRVGDHVCEGSLLFAHRGISGPAVLDASLYWEKGKIEIDFMPGWNPHEYQGSERLLSSILPLPKRVSKAFLKHLEISDQPFKNIKERDRSRLYELKRYIFSPAGTFGYSKAEVTKGGIDTNEIDSKSMMSKKTKGLYFTGEVMDVTGRLGGYNLQWAFSTAYICARKLQGQQ